LREESALRELDGFDVIINEAAVPGLNMSWSHFRLYQDCNLLAVNNLLEFARSTSCKRFVQASTSSVYGFQAIGDENQRLNPSSPYGITKMAAEFLVQNKCNLYSIEPYILRYFSVFGPFQRPDMAFSKFIKAIHEESPIEITGDPFASRSNTYIDDVVKATIAVATNPGNIPPDTYNVSGDRSIPLMYAIELISKNLEKQPLIVHRASRPGDQASTHGDSSKLKSFGILSQEIPFELGIELQVDAFLKSF
jgi:UDP-glucose 4-epimerase